MKPYTICHMIASVDGRIDCDMTEQIAYDKNSNVVQLTTTSLTI